MQYINQAGSCVQAEYNKAASFADAQINKLRQAAKPYISARNFEFALDIIKATPITAIITAAPLPMLLAIGVVRLIKDLKPESISKKTYNIIELGATLFTALRVTQIALVLLVVTPAPILFQAAFCVVFGAIAINRLVNHRRNIQIMAPDHP